MNVPGVSSKFTQILQTPDGNGNTYTWNGNQVVGTYDPFVSVNVLAALYDDVGLYPFLTRRQFNASPPHILLIMPTFWYVFHCGQDGGTFLNGDDHVETRTFTISQAQRTTTTTIGRIRMR